MAGKDEGETRRKNAEAKFASPDGSSVGIGYYFGGAPVSADEFDRLVAQRADRIRDEREAARMKAGEARAGSGSS